MYHAHTHILNTPSPCWQSTSKIFWSKHEASLTHSDESKIVSKDPLSEKPKREIPLQVAFKVPIERPVKTTGGGISLTRIGVDSTYFNYVMKLSFAFVDEYIFD